MMTDIELSKVRNDEIGFVFQTFNLLNRLDLSLENVALTPGVCGYFSKGANWKEPAETLNKVGLGNRLDHKPNELIWRTKTARGSGKGVDKQPKFTAWPMNLLETSTPKHRMKLWVCLKRFMPAGNTIVLVTHEEDIAKHAKKIVSVCVMV